MLPPRGVSTAHRTRTNFVRAGNLPNVITHAKCQIDWYKIVSLANSWSFLFQHYTTTDAGCLCRAACDWCYATLQLFALRHVNCRSFLLTYLLYMYRHTRRTTRQRFFSKHCRQYTFTCCPIRSVRMAWRYYNRLYTEADFQRVNSLKIHFTPREEKGRRGQAYSRAICYRSVVQCV